MGRELGVRGVCVDQMDFNPAGNGGRGIHSFSVSPAGKVHKDTVIPSFSTSFHWIISSLSSSSCFGATSAMKSRCFLGRLSLRMNLVLARRVHLRTPKGGRDAITIDSETFLRCESAQKLIETHSCNSIHLASQKER